MTHYPDFIADKIANTGRKILAESIRSFLYDCNVKYTTDLYMLACDYGVSVDDVKSMSEQSLAEHILGLDQNVASH